LPSAENISKNAFLSLQIILVWVYNAFM